MTDPVLRAFLAGVQRDAEEIAMRSDILRLVPDPMTGNPPCRYHGLLTDVEHFVQAVETLLTP